MKFEDIINRDKKKVKAGGYGLYKPGYLTDIIDELINVEELGKTKLSGTKQFIVSDMLKLINILANGVPQELVFARDARGIYDYIKELSPDELVKTKEWELKGSDIQSAYLIPATFTRSKWLKGPQTSVNYARYSALTPLALYSYKEFFEIKYETWRPEQVKFNWSILADLDKTKEWIDGLATDEAFGFLLGASLKSTESLVGLDKLAPYIELPSVDDTYMKELRELAYTYGNRYNLNSIPKRLKDIEDWGGFGVFYNSLVWPLRNILLQGHTANSKYRVAQAAILDLNNWDIVPQPYDGVTNYKPIRKREDLFEL